MRRAANGEPEPYHAYDGINPGVHNLQRSPLMDHLLRALEEGTDIGDFGRLTFVIVGRHFLDENEMVELLASQPGIGEREARILVDRVNEQDYSPPTREQILEWQTYQDFQLCPEPDDPDLCDVYRQLEFPEYIRHRIECFRGEMAHELV